MTVLTGGRTIWAFVWEDENSFAQEPGDPNDTEFKAFGSQEDISEPDRDNSVETLYRPFNRQPDDYLEMEFEGTWGTEFVYTNPWWPAFIFGSPNLTDNTGSGGDYELDYSLSSDKVPRSAHLIEETHYADGTVTQTVYLGAVVDSPSISTSVQDTLDVSLDGFYVDERHYESIADSPIGEIGDQPTNDFSPLNFASAELFVDVDDDGLEGSDGTGADFVGNVQDLDVDFGAEAEADYELGTRFATDRAYLGFEPDLSYTARITDDKKRGEQKSFYGNQVDTTVDDVRPAEELSDADVAGEVHLFSRKETNEMTLSFGETFPSSYTASNLGDPESAIDDDVERMLRSLTISAITSEDPTTYFPSLTF